jgi:hypothetical protein
VPCYTTTPKFNKAFASLDEKKQRRTAKSLRQLDVNPRHPSLHLGKLEGTFYCTIRVELNFRVALRDLGEGQYELVDIGNHDYIYRVYG